MESDYLAMLKIKMKEIENKLLSSSVLFERLNFNAKIFTFLCVLLPFFFFYHTFARQIFIQYASI